MVNRFVSVTNRLSPSFYTPINFYTLTFLLTCLTFLFVVVFIHMNLELIQS
jgi:hypothetical protein